MKFQTKYERYLMTREKNLGETMTERAGYIPPKIQIEQMILAGVRLDQQRKDLYDFTEDQEDDGTFMDPTREPGYDLADASVQAKQVEDNIRYGYDDEPLTDVKDSEEKTEEKQEESAD